MFQFPAFAHWQQPIKLMGYPIRKSMDQTLTYSFPWLIAVNRVLHRLSMPRHPPLALSSLFTVFASQRLSWLQHNVRGLKTSTAAEARRVFSNLRDILIHSRKNCDLVVKERAGTRGAGVFCSRRRLAPVCGGAEGDRTPDPRVANAMLSQLSYSPILDLRPWELSLRQDSRSPAGSLALAAAHRHRLNRTPEYAVGLDRVELSTSRLSGVRSNHLSYRPGRSRPLSHD